MLSFDISAIDIVLLVAVLVLMLLFTTQQRSKTVTESQLPSSSLEENSEKLETRVESKEHNMKQSQLGFTKCIHDFGYLRNLPQNTPVPDECFGCPTVMRCLFPNVQTQQAE